MSINQITTANTFQQWLVATQDLVGVANNLTDGIGGTFYANTDLVVGGDLTVTQDVSVTGNIATSGNFSVAGNVTGNVVFTGNVSGAAFTSLSNEITGTALAFAIALG